jgi:hypothetical protein
VHVSAGSQLDVDARHSVPADATAFAGQDALAPSQVASSVQVVGAD